MPFPRVIFVTILSMFAALPAAAQVCLGNPDNATAAVRYQTTEGASTAGVDLTHDGGPVLAGISYGRTSFDGTDETGSGVSGLFGVSGQQGPGMACAFIRPGFVDAGATVLNVPLGIGFGLRSDMGDGMFVVPGVQAGVVHSRVRIDGEPVTANELFGSLGVAIGISRVFLRAGIDVTTAEGAETAFSLGGGMSFP